MRKCEWHVIRLKARGQFVGTVKAPDKDAALKAAIKKLNISPEDQKRLLVVPRGWTS